MTHTRRLRLALAFSIPSIWACTPETVQRREDVRPNEQSAFEQDIQQNEFATERLAPTSVPEWAEKIDASDTPEEQQLARWAVNKCEEFTVVERKNGVQWHKRKRQRWTKGDQQRFRKLVAMVTREMGADPKMFQLWSLRESSYRPTAIHVLNPDLDGAAKAWKRHLYNDGRAKQLEGVMGTVGARDNRYWKAKAELSRINTFKDNKYFLDEIEYEVKTVTGDKYSNRRSRWAYGYGPYGFNPTYFLPVWDAEAPPWIFCDEGGIVAVVTAVWASRIGQRECESLGFEGSYETLNRRFSSGHCRERKYHRKEFLTRARTHGINAKARARLGDKYPRETTSREEIVAHMRAMAVEQGLF